ncbi:MAG: adenosylcobinamide-GDP ribazoletransferase [Pseudomonadota bacterium]
MSSVSRELHLIGCAIVFLTRIPVRLKSFPAEDLPLAAAYFPLVGVLVGLLAFFGFAVGSLLWTPLVGAILALAVGIVVTGAFHEDGLADTADGLGGGWSVDRKLAIMKDSRIGTYGACALLLTLMLKVILLAEFASSDAFAALVLGHTLGRWSILPLVNKLPYVSGPGGSGASLVDRVPRSRFVTSSLSSLFLVLLLVPQGALVVCGCVIAVVFACGGLFQRQLGGITGDTLGAANQIVELSVYLALVALAGG